MPQHTRLDGGLFGWARAHFSFARHAAPRRWDAREPDLVGQLQSLFDSARGEYFEDGVRSKFSNRLVSFMEEYGPPAVDALDRVMMGHEDSRVAAEALRWIPYVTERVAYAQRLHLLEVKLFDPSPLLRGAAISGLESLHDARAIGTLKTALEKERLPRLRGNIQEALQELEETQPGR